MYHLVKLLKITGLIYLKWVNFMIKGITVSEKGAWNSECESWLDYYQTWRWGHSILHVTQTLQMFVIDSCIFLSLAG